MYHGRYNTFAILVTYMRGFQYPVTLTPEKKGEFLVRFPDLPEAITSGTDRRDALAQAVDCLEEAIAGRIVDGLGIPKPSPARRNSLLVTLPATMAAKTVRYLAMREAKMKKTGGEENADQHTQAVEARSRRSARYRASFLKTLLQIDLAMLAREMRGAAALTQVELAKLIGTKQSVIARLEAAEYTVRSPALIERIAAACRVARLVPRSKYDLQQLVSRITKKNRHPATDW